MNRKFLTDRSVSTEFSPSIGQYENHQQIADRIEALAIELRTLSDRELEAVPSQQTLASLAKKIYAARRQVDDIFGMHGFAVSPAWDMLLDLYEAKMTGKSISVTSACIGGACPPTTGLRWLQALENMELVVRQPDQRDKRRAVVTLTETACIRVESALVAYL